MFLLIWRHCFSREKLKQMTEFVLVKSTTTIVDLILRPLRLLIIVIGFKRLRLLCMHYWCFFKPELCTEGADWFQSLWASKRLFVRWRVDPSSTRACLFSIVWSITDPSQQCAHSLERRRASCVVFCIEFMSNNTERKNCLGTTKLVYYYLRHSFVDTTEIFESLADRLHPFSEF